MKNLRLQLCGLLLAALVTGCGGGGGGGDNGRENNNNGSDFNGGSVPANAQSASSLFAPAAASPILPFPNDLLFADTNNTQGAVPGFTPDGTLNIPNMSNPPNPLVTNVNLLDGFSTTDNFFTDIAGPIDLATANNGGVVIVNVNSGQLLKPGVDFEVVQSSVVTNRTRLLIRPLKPLQPATPYAVVLTRALRTASGGLVLPSDSFRVVSNPNPVGSPNNPATGFTAEQQELLERVRTLQVRPIFDNFIDLTDRIDGDGVSLTWNFTTQSISDSLDLLAATPTPNPDGADDGGIRVLPFPDGQPGGQLSTGEAIPGAPDTANIFQGTVDISYYLADDDPATDEGTPSDDTPLNTFWQSDGVRATDSQGRNINSGLTRPGGGAIIPCVAFTASASTTKCFPTPRLRSIESVPVIVTVPNANSPSGGTPPAGGWPVVIFQHGITANRTNVLAVAPALANAGFVTVAIDLPLHGVVPDPAEPSGTDAFVMPGNERTFGLDAMPADGNPDSSGANYINLGNPITTRDNNREAVVDLINLNATLRQGSIPVTGGTAIALNGGPSQYLGHSLGAIVGGVLMGVTQNSAIDAATLANPGGGLARLLDGSAAFGPQIRNGLAQFGIAEGSEDYESFIRLTQTITDGGDPINYAAKASANHDIHMIEIVGGANGGNNPPDLVVPNAVVRNVLATFTPPTAGACPAPANVTPFLDTVCVAGPLSGTDPLVTAMGLNSVTIQPPFTAAGSQPADTVVRFTSGFHSSILTPDPDSSNAPSGAITAADAAATTAEIQRETAAFLQQSATSSAAPRIPIGSNP